MKHEFQSILEEQVKEEKEINNRQEKLKKKFGVSGKNVIVVEKNNTLKFTVRTIASILRLAATACILALAFIGIVAMFYDGPRAELQIILEHTVEEIHQAVPFLKLSSVLGG